jgi:hypothetical protein
LAKMVYDTAIAFNATGMRMVPLIKTLEGFHAINDGSDGSDPDFIARGVDGEKWPIKNNIFKRTYAKGE